MNSRVHNDDTFVRLYILNHSARGRECVCILVVIANSPNVTLFIKSNISIAPNKVNIALNLTFVEP